MIVRRGRFYYIHISIPGQNKRIRRSLHTTDKRDALGKAKVKKEELLNEYRRKGVKFSDFCKQYIDWAWSAKPASAKREEQRLGKKVG